MIMKSERINGTAQITKKQAKKQDYLTSTKRPWLESIKLGRFKHGNGSGGGGEIAWLTDDSENGFKVFATHSS